MRKLILAGMAVAMLAVPAVSMATASVASADVARYQTETATFTATQPYGVNDQFNNVWTHKVTVTVNPCDNTFSGTASITGANGEVNPTENWTGSFGPNNTISYKMSLDTGGFVSLTNGIADGVTINHPALSEANPYVDHVDMKFTTPVFTDSSNYKNHGEYVSSQGGGSDAAHSCIGMPIH
jgi:hypothetical protein